MNIKGNLFVSGIFRSGTTLCTRAMDAHPQINLVYQPFTPLFKMWRNLYFKQFVATDFDNDLPMGVDWLHSNEDREKFNAMAMRVYFNKEMIGLLKTQLLENMSLPDQHEKPQSISKLLNCIEPGNAEKLLRQLMEFVHLSSPDSRTLIVGAKEIWSEEFFGPIMRLSDFKVVHLLRDPRAVVASRNSGRILANATNRRKYPILFILKSWRRSVQYRNRFLGDSSYTSILYEDIVLKSEENFRELCKWLQIEFDESMCNPSLYRDGMGFPWNSNSTFKSAREFNSTSISQWEKVLSDQEIGVIEFICGAEMDELGYERTVEEPSVEQFLEYEEDRKQITDWLNHDPYILDPCQKTLQIDRVLGS